jgi:hypothetical protein
MKYTNTIQLFKDIMEVFIDPKITTNMNTNRNINPNQIKLSDIFEFVNNSNNNSSNNNVYAEPKDNDIEFNKTNSMTNNNSNKEGSSYNNSEYNDYSKKQKNMSSKPEGLLDSITQDLTSSRLKQAIILSEIVGKPKSKTRKRRRF